MKRVLASNTSAADSQDARTPMVADPFASMPNAELVEACVKGNSHAWEALLVRYQRLIYSIPFRYGLSVHDADDIFQNVSISLLQNLTRLRDRERLGSWLITATRRECWRTLRHNQQNSPSATPQEIEDQEANKQPVDEDFLDLEGQSIVRSAVALLGASCRDLLTTLFYSDPRPSYGEIARSLSLPAGSIGPTRARCLEKLTKILDRMGFIEK